jgi:hypothetical protein
MVTKNVRGAKMKKLLVLSVLLCVLVMIMSTAAFAQEVKNTDKLGGQDVDDGSGDDSLGADETQFSGFSVRASIDVKLMKLVTTILAELETETGSSTAKVDVNNDGIDDFEVIIDGMNNKVVVNSDSNGNGVMGDPGDDILAPAPGTQQVVDLILPTGDMMRIAAGTDEYNGELYSQFSFYPIGAGTVVITDDTGHFVIFELPPIEGNCVDGIDSDGDLFVDCEDMDCIYEPTCDTGKNKIGYAFRRIRAEAEEIGGTLTGEVLFSQGITPRHHEAAFTSGPVNWAVAPMIDEFEISASLAVNPTASGVQILAMAKSPDLPDFPGVPQGPGLFPGYGAGEILDPDDFAIIKAIGEAYGKGCQDPVIEIHIS